jgi:hypothetical protein
VKKFKDSTEWVGYARPDSSQILSFDNGLN